MTVSIDTPTMDSIASGEAGSDALEEVTMRAELLMRPYVPIRENILRPSVLLASDFARGELVWDLPYAAKQYHVPMSHTDPAGMATDHWDEAMMKDRGEELLEYAEAAYLGGA